ncbi:MAG: hypothetical protein K0R65_1215 [Crocinitomicaceae bacterium]|jgi:uncharacterized protein (DUF58 family)|nr:hypothetical protein [Crocinitomicaceae bacterium]
MTTEELLKKVRKIEIKTKGLTRHIFSGEYHSSFKGRGMAFSEVREYQVGDEVRTIDWNVTARFNTPFVKIFEEERELTVMLVIDLSGSAFFGTQNRSKKELAIELAAVLAFSADSNNDKVGAIFLTDKVEKYIPPAKGKKHVLYLLRELIEFEPQNHATDISEGLRFFRNVTKKRSIGFVISDFISENPFIDAFKISKRRHDIIALRLTDPAEQVLPDLGMIQLFNAETGTKTWVNSSSRRVKQSFVDQYQKHELELHNAFKKSGVDFASFSTTEDYIPVLSSLFQHRR